MIRLALACKRLRVQTDLWSRIICVPTILKQYSVGFTWSWKLLTFFHLQTYKLIHLGIYPDLFINQRSYTNIWLFAKHNHNSGLNTGIVLILLHLKTRYTLNVWKTLQVILANPSNWYNKHKKADLENYIYLNGNTSVPLSRI